MSFFTSGWHFPPVEDLRSSQVSDHYLDYGFFTPGTPRIFHKGSQTARDRYYWDLLLFRIINFQTTLRLPVDCTSPAIRIYEK